MHAKRPYVAVRHWLGLGFGLEHYIIPITLIPTTGLHGTRFQSLYPEVQGSSPAGGWELSNGRNMPIEPRLGGWQHDCCINSGVKTHVTKISPRSEIPSWDRAGWPPKPGHNCTLIIGDMNACVADRNREVEQSVELHPWMRGTGTAQGGWDPGTQEKKFG